MKRSILTLSMNDWRKHPRKNSTQIIENMVALTTLATKAITTTTTLENLIRSIRNAMYEQIVVKKKGNDRRQHIEFFFSFCFVFQH